MTPSKTQRAKDQALQDMRKEDIANGNPMDGDFNKLAGFKPEDIVATHEHIDAIISKDEKDLQSEVGREGKVSGVKIS